MGVRITGVEYRCLMGALSVSQTGVQRFEAWAWKLMIKEYDLRRCEVQMQPWHAKTSVETLKTKVW